MSSDLPVIYSKPGCGACTWTKLEFKKQGLDFVIKDITEDEAAYNEVIALGYQQMPVVFVAPDNHWSGRNPSKIKELAA